MIASHSLLSRLIPATTIRGASPKPPVSRCTVSAAATKAPLVIVPSNVNRTPFRVSLWPVSAASSKGAPAAHAPAVATAPTVQRAALHRHPCAALSLLAWTRARYHKPHSLTGRALLQLLVRSRHAEAYRFTRLQTSRPALPGALAHCPSVFVLPPTFRFLAYVLPLTHLLPLSSWASPARPPVCVTVSDDPFPATSRALPRLFPALGGPGLERFHAGQARPFDALSPARVAFPRDSSEPFPSPRASLAAASAVPGTVRPGGEDGAQASGQTRQNRERSGRFPPGAKRRAQPPGGRQPPERNGGGWYCVPHPRLAVSRASARKGVCPQPRKTLLPGLHALRDPRLRASAGRSATPRSRPRGTPHAPVGNGRAGEGLGARAGGTNALRRPDGPRGALRVAPGPGARARSAGPAGKGVPARVRAGSRRLWGSATFPTRTGGSRRRGP